MRRRALVLVCAVLASTIALFPQAAFACTCAPLGTDLQALRDADAVFAGSVVDTHDPHGDRRIVSSGRPVFYTFEVDSVAKGDVGETQEVRSAASGVSCGFRFDEGRRYLVFAYYGKGARRVDDPDAQLLTSLCTKTRRIAPGAELPFAARDVSDDSDAHGPAVDDGPSPLKLAALAALMAAAGYLLFRRIRA